MLLISYWWGYTQANEIGEWSTSYCIVGLCLGLQVGFLPPFGMQNAFGSPMRQDKAQ